MKLLKQIRTNQTKNKIRANSNRDKKHLRKRGETIMEALVSLLILGLLITSLLSIIRFSLVVTGDSLRNAAETQRIFNELIHGVNTAYLPASTQVTFTITAPVAPVLPAPVTLSQNVRLSADEIFTSAFIPVP